MIPFLSLFSLVLNCNFIYYFFLLGKEMKKKKTTLSNVSCGFVEKEIQTPNFSPK